MGIELGRALLLADAVSPDAMAQALLASVRDRVSLVRALLATDAIDPSRLEDELARVAPDAPLQRHPVPLVDLMERLPPHLCESLLAIPVRSDPRTGTVDVALADAGDTHAAEEIAFYLGAPVRVVRSPLGAIESAIAQVRRESSNPPPSGPISVPPPSPMRPRAHTPVWGSPILELDGMAPAEAPSPTVSERPMPLLPRTPSEMVPGGASARGDAGAATEDIPIPLSRRLTPGAGLVALARAAQDLDDEEEPVVELRRAKPPSGRPRSVPGDDQTATLPSTPLNQLLREMTKVTARDPLMELVLIALRPTAHKTALFAVKKDAYVGWMCTSDFGDREQLAEVRIDSHKQSLLSTTAMAGTYVGPMLRNETHAPLTKFIRAQSPEVLGAAIKVAGRPVVLVIAHEVGEPLRAMTVLTEVARIAGEALERIMRAKR